MEATELSRDAIKLNMLAIASTFILIAIAFKEGPNEVKTITGMFDIYAKKKFTAMMERFKDTDPGKAKIMKSALKAISFLEKMKKDD